MITITEEAKKRVLNLLSQKNDPSYFLRVGVVGGGCSGLSYNVELDNTQSEWDKVFQEGPIRVVCDPKSFVYIDGTQIDYSDALVGGGFQFKNPNASGSCGCGISFAV